MANRASKFLTLVELPGTPARGVPHLRRGRFAVRVRFECGMVIAKWETPRPQGTSLRPFDVHIWRLDLDAADPGDLGGILSEDERERARCFHWRTDQDRFVVAHAGLRPARWESRRSRMQRSRSI